MDDFEGRPDEAPALNRGVMVRSYLVGTLGGLISMLMFLAAWASGETSWHVAWLVWYFVLTALISVSARWPRIEQHRLDRLWAERFRELSVRDELTGLYNRRYFNNELGQAFESDQSLSVALVLIDLNELKSINDTLGHVAGDRAIQGAARAIQSAVPDGGIVARIGGDEFAVLFPAAADGTARSFVENLDSAFEGTPLVYDGTAVRLRAAAGLAERPPHTDPDALLRAADQQLYARKAEMKQKRSA